MSRAHYQPSESLMTDPIRSLVAPGYCQLPSDQWTPCPLIAKIPISPNTYLLRFQLPNISQPLNLSTCSCILARIDDHDGKKGGGTVIRPYTPISTNQLIGCFDLLVKDYGPKAQMSHTLCHRLSLLGETDVDDHIQEDTPSRHVLASFSHSNSNVKIQASTFIDDKYDHIVMLAGGTGITPMLQALHALLGQTEHDGDDSKVEDEDDGDKASDMKKQSGSFLSSWLVRRRRSRFRSTSPMNPRGSKTKITLLYGSKTENDILALTLLDRWRETYKERLTVEYILSQESRSSWTGKRGIIDKILLQEHGIYYRPQVADGNDDTTTTTSATTTNDANSETKQRGTSILVMVCGPPSFYDSLCGPREERDKISGILGDLGFTPDQVYKF